MFGEVLPYQRLQRLSQRVAWLCIFRHDNKGLYQFGAGVIGDTNDRCELNRGAFKQAVLNFRRSNSVSGACNDVIRTAVEPQKTVLILLA